MVKVKYRTRIFADQYFLDTILSDFSLLRKLMYIKAASKDHPTTHNIMLTEDADLLVGVGVLRLHAAFKRIPLPSFLGNEPDEIARNVKVAIHLTDSEPYRTVILTSPGKLSEYEENQHFRGMKTISAKADVDAKELINQYFQEFSNARDSAR